MVFLSKLYSDPVPCYLSWWLRGKETLLRRALKFHLQDVPAWLRYRQALHSVNTLRVAGDSCVIQEACLMRQFGETFDGPEGTTPP